MMLLQDSAIDEAIRQHPEYSLAQIAKATGYSYGKIKTYVRQHPECGYINKRSVVSPQRKQRIETIADIIMRHPGYSCAEIAETTGLKKSTVYETLTSVSLKNYLFDTYGLIYTYQHGRIRRHKLTGNQRKIADVAARARASGMTYGEYVGKGGK